MKISFNPPRARIVAVVIAAWMIWHFVQTRVRWVSIDIRFPNLTQPYFLGALAIVAIVIVGIYRLIRNGRR